MDQILKLVPIVKDTNNILSIFVGRIYDSGIDGENYLKEIIGNKIENLNMAGYMPEWLLIL